MFTMYCYTDIIIELGIIYLILIIFEDMFYINVRCVQDGCNWKSKYLYYSKRVILSIIIIKNKFELVSKLYNKFQFI